MTKCSDHRVSLVVSGIQLLIFASFLKSFADPFVLVVGLLDRAFGYLDLLRILLKVALAHD